MIPAEPAPYGHPLEIAVQRCGDEALVQLAGSVDIDDTEQLRARLDEAIGPTARFVIFDLAQLQFLNSLAISELLAIYRKTRGGGGGMALVSPQPRVAGVLRVTRIDELVPIAGSVDAARAALRSDQPTL